MYNRIKEILGKQAAKQVHTTMKLGLGTGSTVWHFLQALATRLLEEPTLQLTALPSSKHTYQAVQQLYQQHPQLQNQLQLISSNELSSPLDLTVDGLDACLNGCVIVKGCGGALFCERLLVYYSKQILLLGETHKQYSASFPPCGIPIEISPFCASLTQHHLHELGWHTAPHNSPFMENNTTDQGNLLFLLTPRVLLPPSNWHTLYQQLLLLPGVVSVGLFLDCNATLLVANPTGQLTSLQILSSQTT